MARADLLVSLFEAGMQRNIPAFKKVANEIIREKRDKKQRHLAEKLESIIEADATGESLVGLIREVKPSIELQGLSLSVRTRELLSEIIHEHMNKDLLTAKQVKPRNKLLLVGQPGNGRSLAAQALAKALNVTLIEIPSPALIGAALSRVDELLQFMASRRSVFYISLDAFSDEDMNPAARYLLMGINDLPADAITAVATYHPRIVSGWCSFDSYLGFPRPNKEQIERALASLEEEMGLESGVIARFAEYAADKAAIASFADLSRLRSNITRRILVGKKLDSIQRIIAHQIDLLAEDNALRNIDYSKAP